MADVVALEAASADLKDEASELRTLEHHDLVIDGDLPENPFQRSFERGEVLFREGEAKSQVYRVETGIVCLTARRPVGPPAIVELVFAGGFVGLGFLERHIHSATAVVSSRLSLWPVDSIAALCDGSYEARERQATAVEREFEYRRREVTGEAAQTPLLRVAAYLSAVAHINRREGRAAHIVPDNLTSGAVASFLDLDIAGLAEALCEMERRDLVTADRDGGLVLLDLEGIEKLVAVH